jgi:hypothetical protein
LAQEAAHNLFQVENNRNDKVVIDGNSLTEYSPRDGQDEFEMFNLNNEFGAFYALTSTTYNTFTTDTASQTNIEKFAIVLSEATARRSSNDCLLIASPRGLDQLAIKLYASSERLGFFQKLFGLKGRLEPKTTTRKLFNFR